MDNSINIKLNFSFKVNQQILKLISFIDTFKGKWNIIEYSVESVQWIPDKSVQCIPGKNVQLILDECVQ